jgi:hypothetical protein
LDGYQILPRYQNDLQFLVSTSALNSQKGLISIFPNPFVSDFTLDSKEVIRSVYLRNLDGNLLRTWDLDRSSVALFVTDVPAGFYLLECHTAKGVQVIKAIKTK